MPMIKYNAKQLRRKKPTEELAQIKRRPVHLILDNVLDTYNIGGLFRIADAVSAREIILCGQSETPPSSRIHKAAVGLEEWVPWRYEATAKEAVENLRLQHKDIKIVAVEQSEKSIPYHKMEKHLLGDFPIAIVVGHETEGVNKNVLDMADLVLEIPLYGVNKSLNVIVSASIVLYKLLEIRSKGKTS